MAIKFRCPHCLQLLGISTTKKGRLSIARRVGDLSSFHTTATWRRARNRRRKEANIRDCSTRCKLSALGSLDADDPAPRILPELLKPDLNSALWELAAAAPVVQQQPVKPSKITGAFQSDTRRFSLLPLMLMLPAFAAGLLMGKFWRSRDHLDAATADPKSTVATAPEAAIQRPAASERQLQGIVRFVNDAGNTAADAGRDCAPPANPQHDNAAT